MQRISKRIKVGSFNAFLHACKVRDIEREQRDWVGAAGQYANAKNALMLAHKVRHGSSIDYWTRRVAELEAKYPSLKKG